MLVLDEAMERGQARQKLRLDGQGELFGVLESDLTETALPEIDEWPEHQLLSFEKEVLGLYLTSHPLTRYRKDLTILTNADTETLADLENNVTVKLGGVLAEVKEITTKKGDRMAFLTLEDMKGRVELTLFPALFQTVRPYVRVDLPVLIEGVMDKSEERVKVKVSSLVPLDDAKADRRSTVHVTLPIPDLSKDQLVRLKEILETNRGKSTVMLHLAAGATDSEVIIALPPDLNVEPSEAMRKSVRGLCTGATVEVT
jgi:DNA polymerase-3 subunit alpha